MKAIILSIFILSLIGSIYCAYTCPQWNTTVVDNMCKTLGVRMLPATATLSGNVEYKYAADNCCFKLAYTHDGQTSFCTLNWDTDDGKVDMDWRSTDDGWTCVP
ncbi:hypothetical protein ABK040_009698 [Willaertia magna]